MDRISKHTGTVFSAGFRVGVFDASGVRLATIELDGHRMSGSGDLDLEAPAREALQVMLDADDGRAPVDVFIQALQRLIAADDLHVFQIEEADHSLSVAFEASSGAVVGRSRTSQGIDPLSASIERNITAAVGTAIFRFADTLAERIASLSAVEAVDAVRSAHGAGEFNFPPTDRLGDALERIGVDELDDTNLREFLSLRTGIAMRLRRYGHAARDAEVLLARWTDHAPATEAEFRNIVAIGHAEAGQTESAITIWQSLVDGCAHIGAAHRSEILRNLALTVPRSDKRALLWIERCVDASMEARDVRRTAEGLIEWSIILEHHDARKSVVMLERAEGLLDNPGPLDDALRSELMHARARSLSALGRGREALSAAMAALQVRKGLSGQDDALFGSYALAWDLAKRNDDPIADALRSESLALLEETPNARFSIATKLERLRSAWDANLASELRMHLDAPQDEVIEIAIHATLLTLDPALSVDARIFALETVHARMMQRGVAGELLTPIRLGLSYALLDVSGPERSAEWLRRILADAPLAGGVAEQLLDRLTAIGDWEAGAVLARREIALKGENFERLIALAKVSLNAGERDEGLRSALIAKTLAETEDERHVAEALALTALQDGASLVTASAGPAVAAVSAEQFHEALAAFAAKTSSDYRMNYWRRPEAGSDHRWISSPERYAQGQLRTWLDATFRGRVTVLEEVGAGAGRLDLLIQLAGGTRVILELKMLGYGYSAAYAASGIDQVLHYMHNSGVGIGYLVAFDARIRENAEPLLKRDREPGMTVQELFVDIRPRIEKRGGARG